MSILDGAILFECLVIYMLSQNFQNLTHTVSIQNLTSFSFCWNVQGGDEFLKSIHVVTFLHWKDEWEPNSLKCFGHFVIKSVYFGLWNENSNFVWFRTVFCQTYHCTNPQSIFNRNGKLLISQFSIFLVTTQCDWWQNHRISVLAIFKCDWNRNG